MPQTITEPGFYAELVALLEKHEARWATSNTPPTILADYLINCLTCYAMAIAKRQELHGRPKTDIRSIRTGMKV